MLNRVLVSFRSTEWQTDDLWGSAGKRMCSSNNAFYKYPKLGFFFKKKQMQWWKLFTSPTWPTEIPYGVLKTPHWVIGPNERRLDALRVMIGCCERQSTEVPRWRWFRKHGTGTPACSVISLLPHQGQMKGASKYMCRIRFADGFMRCYRHPWFYLQVRRLPVTLITNMIYHHIDQRLFFIYWFFCYLKSRLCICFYLDLIRILLVNKDLRSCLCYTILLHFNSTILLVSSVSVISADTYSKPFTV